MVHNADIRDRDGTVPLLTSVRKTWPWLRNVLGDGSYAGSKLEDALVKASQWMLEIVKQSDTTKGFELLPTRWIVERMLV